MAADADKGSRRSARRHEHALEHHFAPPQAKLKVAA